MKFHLLQKILSKPMLFLVVMGCISPPPPDVHVVGAMKNVMQKGELFGRIALDTISTKVHLYGLGPLENLAGEITIVDGVSYVATVVDDSAMQVEKRLDVKAPFFVYARVDQWEEHKLPDSVRTLHQLESFLEFTTEERERPFAFRLTGEVNSASIHVVNLPQGSEVRSPGDAHRGQRNFLLKNTQVEIIGFFSTAHQGVFTHHDSFLHAHLLTADKSKMGHLDAVEFVNRGIRLFLPG